VTHAYCVELDKEVTIDEARRSFFDHIPKPARYTFLCSFPACRGKEVVITGVNYTLNAEESAKVREAHFAARNPERHVADCEWRLADDESTIDERPFDALDEHSQLRRLRRKLTDLITEFDPLHPAEPAAPMSVTEAEAPIPLAKRQHDRAHAPRELINDRTRTNDLERLVQSYREARQCLSSDELHAYQLAVVGHGRVRLVDYFCHLSRADVHTTDVIIHGGARLEGRYGNGFKLRFLDRKNNLPVFLYVDRALMATYRHRRYLEGIVVRAPKHRYVTAYINGRLVLSPSGKSYGFQIDDLRQLALVLGPIEEEAKSPIKESPVN
jgi:hypothetical protein